MEIQLEGAELHVAGQNLTEIPSFLAENYGSVVRCLDLSFNDIKHLTNLEGFKNLESLVVDNNELVSDQRDLPKMDTVHTLSVNSNMIDDLVVFLDHVTAAFENLTFLSLWKNDCCPNEMIVGKDSDDYKRYRYYVVYRIPTLKYLDSTAITAQERQEAKRVGALMRVAKPKRAVTGDASRSPGAGAGAGSGPGAGAGFDTGNPDAGGGYAPLPKPADAEEDGGTAPGASRFGRSRYVYYGKQSEGNRFILNDDL